MNNVKFKSILQNVPLTLVVVFGFSLAVTFTSFWPEKTALAQESPANQYSGSKKCKKCHLKVHKAFFANTRKAKALDTLKPDEYYKVEDLTDSGKLCIECHVTGFGKPGGFNLPEDKAEFEKILGDKDSNKKLMEAVGHVGCESCHGPGLGHVEMDKKELTRLYEEGKNSLIERRLPNVCVDCHNPHVSHVRGEEVKGTWTKNREPSTASFEGATYIGVEACKSCHEDQYKTWSRTKHASTFAVLKDDEYEKMDDAVDPKMKLKRPPEARKCIECHVTGYGEGGFKSLNDPESKKFLNVQCEVCHGPGSLHKKMADEYEAAGKDLKGIKDQKLNRVPQNVCRKCHHIHISHKLKYPGRRPE